MAVVIMAMAVVEWVSWIVGYGGFFFFLFSFFVVVDVGLLG